jgi:NAD(P)-dependent dehydrogenase (short-subunit alcohol dehydrogenase family)
MNKEFSGKTVIVTGGGSGIGKATALAFGREEANVFIIDIDETAGKETLTQLERSGGNGYFCLADVSNENDVHQAVEQCINVYGQIDCAYNNAGIVVSKSTVECTEEIWDRIINTNLKGIWLCMKYEIPQMLKKQHGVIVNASSIAGLIGRGGDMPYNVSKFGIIGLTKTAALEVAGKGLRINCVCPGAILTPWVKKVSKKLNELQPMGRIGQAEEVADAVLWLCSEKSTFVTGHALVIDGGRIAGEW